MKIRECILPLFVLVVLALQPFSAYAGPMNMDGGNIDEIDENALNQNMAAISLRETEELCKKDCNDLGLKNHYWDKAAGAEKLCQCGCGLGASFQINAFKTNPGAKDMLKKCAAKDKAADKKDAADKKADAKATDNFKKAIKTAEENYKKDIKKIEAEAKKLITAGSAK